MASSLFGAPFINAWTNSASGDWHDETSWSLRARPAPDQTVIITNRGWKAVGISRVTSDFFAESLVVQSIILGGDTNSYNTLLLNFAGYERPLMAGSIHVGTNSAITALRSALEISTNLGTGDLTLESAFNHGENTTVRADSIQIGTMDAAGVYNFTNGNLAAQQATLGVIIMPDGFPYPNTAIASPFNSSSGFKQLSGSVALSSLRLDGGTYTLSGGALTAPVLLRRGEFQQTGGSVTGAVEVAVGTYLLSNGTLRQHTLEVPSSSGWTTIPLDATFLQTGGTNYCDGILVYNYYGSSATPIFGTGRFVISNGVLNVANLTRSWAGGDFQQWAGLHTNAGTVVVGEEAPPFHAERTAGFKLGGGTLLTPSISIDFGSFEQSGGTNRVATHLAVGDPGRQAQFTLSGGLLSDSTAAITAGGFPFRVTDLNASFTQSGGIHVVTNLLSVNGPLNDDRGGSARYTLNGGQLMAGALELTAGGVFSHSGGTLTLGGPLTLDGGVWDEKATGQQFGQLVLQSVKGSNSTLQFPPGSCQLRFANSSTVAWSSQARLFIQGWNGSAAGGGQHQVFFGANATGLTAQQLGLVQFINPAGATGVFPSMILPTGEIVPSRFLATRNVSPNLVIEWSEGTLQTATNVIGPYLDLAVTSPYTNSFSDPQRFFRLVVSGR